MALSVVGGSSKSLPPDATPRFTSVRLAASVLIAGTFVLCALIPAHAMLRQADAARPREGQATRKNAKERKIPQGWAWQAQRDAAPSLKEASGVPDKDLAVAFFGVPDKLTYLGITGGSLRGAMLELKVDNEANNVNPEEAELQGCLILQDWEPAKPMAWDTKPVSDCDVAASGSYEKKTKTFAFDLTPLARALAPSGTYGVSIEPVDEPKSNFQVAFKGGDAVVVKKSSGRGLGPFPAPGGPSSDSGEGTGAASEALPPSLDFSNSSGSASAPPMDTGPLASDVEAPVAIPNAAPAATEQEPATFALVYLALMGAAAGPLTTRVLAYTLPTSVTKKPRR